MDVGPVKRSCIQNVIRQDQQEISIKKVDREGQACHSVQHSGDRDISGQAELGQHHEDRDQPGNHRDRIACNQDIAQQAWKPSPMQPKPERRRKGRTKTDKASHD